MSVLSLLTMLICAQGPVVLEAADPVYPAAALEARVEATLVLRLGVDESGRVESAEVMTSTLAPASTGTTSLGFDEAARAAALAMRFEPYRIEGTAVPFELDYTLRFTLPPPPSPAPEPEPTPPSAFVEADPEQPLIEQYDVTVEADHVTLELSRRSLSAEAISQVAGTLGDPVLVVENLPGVARTGLAGGNAVRGSSPQDSVAMVEGIPILFETHFGGFRGVVAPGLVEGIDFHPGNFRARYGRRTGGILDVQLKSLTPDRFHGEVELSMLDAGLYLELPLFEGLSVALAGRRSHIDLLLNAAVPDDAGVALVAAPRYYDYQALVDWRPGADHLVRLFILGSEDRMELLFDNVSDADAQARSSSARSAFTFQRVSADYRYSGERLQNELQVSLGGDQIDQSIFGRFDFQTSFLNLVGREALTLKASDGLTVTLGADVQHRIIDYDITSPRPPKEGQPDGFATAEALHVSGQVRPVELGLYLEAELALGTGLRLIPGFRADYYSLVGSIGLDPRVLLRWTPLSALTLKAGLGVVHQQPELDEVVAPFGNPDLGLLSARHYSVGAEWSPLDFLSADVTLFYKDLDGLVSSSDQIEDRNGVPTPVLYDNQGEGRAYGVELLLRHTLAHDLEGWLSYTLSRSERTDSGASAVRTFDYDQTHILTMVGTYHLGAGWSVGARWRYVSGRPVTPLLGGVWRADLDSYEAIPGAPNSARLPAFHQLDLRVDKRWTFEAWELSAYLSLSNAYNQANVESLGYNFDYTRDESVHGLPLLPIFGLKGRI